MKKKPKSFRIFISAAEPSADMHCANLIKSLRKTNNRFHFVGLGGEQMKAAGCELIEDMSARAAMHYKVLGQLGYYWNLLGRVKDYFRSNKIDLVIVCDSPSWNFLIAKRAKKAGIKTLFYVAPQLWAWGQWRIKKMRRLCDKLACLLPFEEKWFRDRGVDAEFVGNPLFDNAPAELGMARAGREFREQSMQVALMPGSRKAEIETLWEPMQRIASRLQAVFPDLKVTAVAANEKIREELKRAQITGFEPEYAVSSVISTACKADLTIVASGSATLQVAAAGCPMIVMYQANKVLWKLVGKRLIKTSHLSLVNILAGKELVPEFMPYFDSIEPIFGEAESLLFNPRQRQEMSRAIVSLTDPLIGADASGKTAKMVLEILSKAKNGGAAGRKSSISGEKAYS